MLAYQVDILSRIAKVVEPMAFWQKTNHDRVSLIVISLFVSLLLGVPVLSMADGRETSFSAVVQSCYSSWVPDGSNWLTPSRITQLVLNHQIKGDEAAAIAAIHIYFRGHKDVSRLSKADLLQADMDQDPHEHTEDLPQALRFNVLFRKFTQHLKLVHRTMFTENAPRLEGIHQGPLGDCWVLSSVGAAVHFHPLRLKEMIHSQPDGSCNVEFRNGKSVLVNSLTDSQIALSSTSGDQGLWLNVLEQAFGQVNKALTPKDREELGLDSINRGGNACHIITLLTGHPATHIHIRPIGAKAFPPDLRKRPGLVGQVRNIIQKAVDQKHLLVAGTTARGTFPPGIGHPHDYAVLDYNAESDSVTLWNPHGSKFDPKGAPGLINGYSMANGILSIPLNDFTLIFGGLFLETPSL